MKKIRELRQAEKVLREELGRTPNRSELSEKLDVPVKKVDQVLQVRSREMSIDDTVGREQKTPVSDFLVDQGTESPESELLKREGTELVTVALDMLSEQERHVVKHRFGLDGCPVLTLKEIGEQMGVSRERVRQIETQAKERLRRLFARPRGLRAATRRRLARRKTRRQLV